MFSHTSHLEVFDIHLYTETIKLCPLDVYVCQFQIYERISFKFLTLPTVIIQKRFATKINSFDSQ